MKDSSGWSTTANSVGRHWQERASIGPSPTTASTRKPSPGEPATIPRCSYCVQDDHTSELCTKNPARACFGWPAGFLVWPAVQPPPPTFPTQGWPQPSPEPCRRFNSGRCFAVRCRYTHACTECGGGHPTRDCPRARSGLPARARSPLRAPQRGFQPPGFHQPSRQMPSRPM